MTVLRESLEICIAELTQLLEIEDAKESEFQSWFERHPVAWTVLGFRRCIPHPELVLPGSAVMIPDFLAKRADGLWEIVELKRANTSVLKSPERRAAFYSEMNSYVAQCQEYSERCFDSVVAKNLFDVFGVSINGAPSSIIVAGRSAGLDRLRVHGLLKRQTPKISHYTFDDVLEALHHHYVSNFSGPVDAPGLSLFAIVGLIGECEKGDEYLFDLGQSEEKNRISIVRRSNDVITFSVIDALSLRHLQDIRISDLCEKERFFCGIHVTHTESFTLILLEINGSYVGQHQVSGGDLAFEYPLPVVLAADMRGMNSGAMLLGEFIFRGLSLAIAERALMREYFFEKIWPSSDVPTSSNALKFWDGRFMYTVGHPLLDAAFPRETHQVQRNDDLRPILVNWS